MENQFLVKELLLNFYGPIVSKVGCCLCTSPLRVIDLVKEAEFNVTEIKKALQILLQHRLIICFARKREVYYKGKPFRIWEMANLPRIVYQTRNLYGQEEELLVEKMFLHGMMPLQKIFQFMMSEVKELREDITDEMAFNRINNALQNLVKTHFIQREKQLLLTEDRLVPRFNEENYDNFRFYEASVTYKGFVAACKSEENDSEPPPAKRLKSEGLQKNTSEFSMYWSINKYRYRQVFRDEVIVKAITNKYDVMQGQIIRAMLRLSELTTPYSEKVTSVMSVREIHRQLPHELNICQQKLKASLDMLKASEDKIVEHDGGTSDNYYINVRNAITKIAEGHVFAYIEQRFGQRSCRVCRVLLQKGALELKQIEALVLEQQKVCKDLVYTMMEENVIVYKELSRSANIPAMSTNVTYLFSLNMSKIIADLIERSYKTVANSFYLQRLSKIKNQRNLLMLEKHEAIKDNCNSQEEIDAIENEMDGVVRSELQKHDQLLMKTSALQLGNMETAQLLHYYNKLNAPRFTKMQKKNSMGEFL